MTAIQPAATVILVKDSEKGLETLLLRRSKALNFVGGAWVFPGGQIDPTDYSDDQPDSLMSAARQAAVREADEEAGIPIDPGVLVYCSRWTTPEESPKRYDTWFFIAAVNTAAVRIDGTEIREYKWFQPAEALASQRAGKIELMPPTLVTLQELTRFDTTAAALNHYQTRLPPYFLPRIVIVPGGICSFYQGDAGYETKDPQRPGPRHRLWMMDSGWRYEKSDGVNH